MGRISTGRISTGAIESVAVFRAGGGRWNGIAFLDRQFEMTDAQRFHELPSLQRDRSFWGMTATQFLGAFNDNLYKQMVLLLCIEYSLLQTSAVAAGEASGSKGQFDYQTVAQAMFALPFVLLSGFAGFLSDRYSKRSLVVICKVAEIAVMGAAMIAFFTQAPGSPALIWTLLCVLFCMGAQSAFFGPAKYGILPEMLRGGDLPSANGIIQMTTFLAIIFGTAAAGYSKDFLERAGSPESLWMISAMCVGIAVVGTVTSLFVRRTPVAHPGLEFTPSALAIKTETWQMLRHDRPLMGVLLISSLFWFLGGLVLPAVNQYGKVQLALSDFHTSLLATCMGVGIAGGCAVGGQLSKHTIRFELVTIGAWGMVATFAALAGLGISGWSTVVVEHLSQATLVAMGFFAGVFVVPLQVYLQARPPKDQKGRMIGAMNLVNWTGILISALFFGVLDALCRELNVPISWAFGVTALFMLPVALAYRPRNQELNDVADRG